MEGNEALNRKATDIWSNKDVSSWILINSGYKSEEALIKTVLFLVLKTKQYFKTETMKKLIVQTIKCEVFSGWFFSQVTLTQQETLPPLPQEVLFQLLLL